MAIRKKPARRKTSSPAKKPKARVHSGRARAKSPTAGNGLTGFAAHEGDGTKAHRDLFEELRAPHVATAGFAARAGQLGSEAVARNYLERALASDTAKAFVRPHMQRAPQRASKRAATASANTVASEFKSLGSETIPLTGTKVVKFRQTFSGIPVYGSLVSVELDDANRCLGINSSLASPTAVSPIAKISPARALAIAASQSGNKARSGSLRTPQLYYYYRPDDESWHLAYIIEDAPARKKRPKKLERETSRRDAAMHDYVVDAHDAKLLAVLPRTPTMAAQRGAAAVQEDATDGLGARRKLTVSRTSNGKKTLADSELNVVTFDFGFRDPWAQEDSLPGKLVTSPPKPWPIEAVSAHANAEAVASFLRDVVKRNNIDNRGGAMRSSVNCWDKSEGVRPARQWKNAFWNGRQMVYGQIKNGDGSFFSIANMQDVVAHEMFHGVTDHTSRLEYRLQSGALNESYSDIFGAIVANFARPLADWVWRLGEGFDGPGTALRDMSDPTRFGQPKHMRDFQRSTPPYDDDNDYGGVHDNSGIHNFAAYSVISAKSGGRYVFTAADVAGLFYLALTVHLSRTSQFSDSRRAVIQSARTLFRNEAAAKLTKRIRAIEAGFDAAGIA